MSARNKPLQPPQGLEIVPPLPQIPGEVAEDSVEKPYDIYSHEASELVDALLQHRLGTLHERRDSYIAAPRGSKYPGFQQEYPIGFYNGDDGPLMTGVVLKGEIRRGEVWMNTLVASIVRSKEGVVALEPLAIIIPGYATGRDKIGGDILDNKGRYNNARAARTVGLLRQAKSKLLLVDYLTYLNDQM